MRLDLALVHRKLVPSRARARDLILRGKVSVDGQVAIKPAQAIDDGMVVGVAGAAAYVSRGAEKLVGGLEHFGFIPTGKICLDIGASTGGFTQVLLDRGASKVYAVDVGRSQLHEQLRQDRRVVSLEETDARGLDGHLIADPIGAVVADVSFIALSKAISAPLALAVSGAWLIALVKPQFEVGRENIGKGGIVRDEGARLGAVGDVSAWLAGQGWLVKGYVVSPIHGGDGNEEFLVGALKA